MDSATLDRASCRNVWRGNPLTPSRRLRPRVGSRRLRRALNDHSARAYVPCGVPKWRCPTKVDRFQKLRDGRATRNAAGRWRWLGAWLPPAASEPGTWPPAQSRSGRPVRTRACPLGDADPLDSCRPGSKPTLPDSPGSFLSLNLARAGLTSGRVKLTAVDRPSVFAAVNSARRFS